MFNYIKSKYSEGKKVLIVKLLKLQAFQQLQLVQKGCLQ